MRKLMQVLVVSAFVLVLPGTVLADTIIVAFSGSGVAGVDPFGHPWTVGSTDDGDGAWGIPGLGAGTEPYAGSETAYDFHVTFFDDLGAIAIDDITPVTGAGGYDESTRFSDTLILWTRVVSGNSVSFFAPGTDGLDLGESFFVNVTFLRPIVGTLSFDAAWTAPEPTSLLLLGTGILGSAGIRRWRQRKA